MQKLNYFLVVCAVAATACVVPMGHAQDTEAQAKARQALREKLSQLDGSAPVPQDTEAQAKAREALRKQSSDIQPTAPQPVVAQPAAAAAPVAITMAPAAPATDPQTIEKARQAVRQELDQLNHGSPDSPEVAKAREATRQKLAASPQPATAAAVVGTDSAAKAARAQSEAQSKAEKAAQLEADKAEAAAQAERRAKRDANLSPNAFQPIESPALPISTAKQQRLADLLQKYRADQLTPEQYHLERAKILAEQ